MKKMIIGADKSGFPLKEALVPWLEAEGFAVDDVGTKDIENFQPYFEVAPKVAKRIQSGEYAKGILICGTGMGMSIAANKFSGIYAAVVENPYTAKMCSVINKANVLALGGWVTTEQQAVEMIRQWLGTDFGDGFPPERIQFLQNAFEQVQAIEKENFK